MLSLNFLITFPNERATPGTGGFSDLAIFGWICRVNMYIEGYDLRCAVFLSELLCSVHLCNIQNSHTSHSHLGFQWLYFNIIYYQNKKSQKPKRPREVWKFLMLHSCTLYRSWDKITAHLRSYPSKYMFTLRIHLKIAKSEKPLAPGVALSFGEVMKTINCRINWDGKVNFWAQFCNQNCCQSSIKWTRQSMTTFVGNAYSPFEGKRSYF